MTTHGWVYLARSGDVPGTPVKIGFSKDPYGRLRSQQTFHPEPLHILGALDGTMRLEKTLQAFYWPFRVRGEWFWPNRALFAEFGLGWHQREADRPTHWGEATKRGVADLPLAQIGHGPFAWAPSSHLLWLGKHGDPHVEVPF